MGRMRSIGNGRFGQFAAVVAAPLVAAAIGFGASSPSHAQLPDLGLLNKLKNLKKPPAGKAQVPKGVVGVPGAKGPGRGPIRPGFANRPGVGGPNAATMPNGHSPAPNGLPNNARINPALPNTKTGIAPALNAKAGGPPTLNAKGGAPLGLNAKGGPAGLNAKGFGNTPGVKGTNLPNTKS